MLDLYRIDWQISIHSSQPSHLTPLPASTPCTSHPFSDLTPLPASLPSGPQDYAQLLSELKGECGSSSLNPNELEAVIKVIILLADTVSSQRYVPS